MGEIDTILIIVIFIWSHSQHSASNRGQTGVMGISIPDQVLYDDENHLIPGASGVVNDVRCIKFDVFA